MIGNEILKIKILLTHSLTNIFLMCPEDEFKEFEWWLKFKPRLKNMVGST